MGRVGGSANFVSDGAKGTKPWHFPSEQLEQASSQGDEEGCKNVQKNLLHFFAFHKILSILNFFQKYGKNCV